MRTPSRLRAALAGAALTTLALTAAGTAPALAADQDPTIVGGTEAPAGAYPWMANLSIEASGGTYMCGGSLVSPDVIVTAQHCMEGATGVSAQIGEVDPSQATPVDGVDWVAGGGVESGDWAVIKLAEPVEAAEMPALASDASYDEGPTFTAAGWGATSEGGPTSDVLMEVDLPFVSDADCGAGEEEVCAGDLQNGGIDTCQGDSGGPLLNTADGRPVLVGITSWGNGCAQPGEAGHYTQVSTYDEEITGAIADLGGQAPTLS